MPSKSTDVVWKHFRFSYSNFNLHHWQNHAHCKHKWVHTFTAFWGDGVKCRVKCFISNISAAKPGSGASALYCAIITEETPPCNQDLNPSFPQRMVRCQSCVLFLAVSSNNSSTTALRHCWAGEKPQSFSSCAGAQSHRHHGGGKGRNGHASEDFTRPWIQGRCHLHQPSNWLSSASKLYKSTAGFFPECKVQLYILHNILWVQKKTIFK